MPPSVSSCLDTRYVAVDLHKHYFQVAAVDAHYQVVLAPRRVELADWSRWHRIHLRPTDQVVIESTTNAWHVYDELAPMVSRVVVANPLQVKWIASARVKTDTQDCLRLAKLLAADLVPEVWVPPLHVRDLRALVNHRSRLVAQRTRLCNGVQSILQRHNIAAPAGDPCLEGKRAWWDAIEVSYAERLRIEHSFATLDHLGPQIASLDEALRRQATQEPWGQMAPYLIQLPGIGPIIAMTVLAAIGDISRFPTASHLVGYAGLGASVHDSGTTHRTGRITKQGRRELRHVMVEAAWTAVNSQPHWKATFERLERRMVRTKAIVAIARKLLVVVWHVLTERAADRHADPDMVAFKFMTWSWKLSDEERGGLSTREFVRYHLLRLRLGDDLTHVVRGGKKRLIAPAEEVVAKKPELLTFYAQGT